jgi:hypothetical protein
MTARRLFRGDRRWACSPDRLLSLVAPSLRPVTFLPHDLEHLASLCITGWRSASAIQAVSPSTSRLLAIFAAADRAGAVRTPGRHPRLIDFVVGRGQRLRGRGAAAMILRLFARPAERGL